MITAFALIQGEKSKLPQTAEAIADIPGVTEVYSVAGEYDLIAVIRVKEHEDLAEVVTKRLLPLGGIVRSNTLIAFRAYSRKDLESMWDIGV
jgi:DNA-binding Lrp family transcriptional regulator